MQRFVRVVILGAGLLTFSGCAVNRPLHEPAMGHTFSPGKAYLVGSVSQTARSTHIRPFTDFLIRQSSDGTGRLWLGEDVALPVRILSEGGRQSGGVPFVGDFPGENGRVFLIEMEPGEYELYDFRLHGQNVVYRLKHQLPLPIVAQAGEVHYIGNIHMHIGQGKNLLGINIYYPAAVAFSDQGARDLPLLRARHVWLAERSIQLQLLDGSPWVNLTAPDAPDASVDELAVDDG
jgi:hypothetical protein